MVWSKIQVKLKSGNLLWYIFLFAPAQELVWLGLVKYRIITELLTKKRDKICFCFQRGHNQN